MANVGFGRGKGLRDDAGTICDRYVMMVSTWLLINCFDVKVK